MSGGGHMRQYDGLQIDLDQSHRATAVRLDFKYARERLIGAFDPQIGWLHKHKACAEDALRDLKRGHKIEIDGKDVTQEWIPTYEQIIAKYQELIAACARSQKLVAAYNARSH
jgi:hypothetical protein